jgi:hypothetical protein
MSKNNTDDKGEPETREKIEWGDMRVALVCLPEGEEENCHIVIEPKNYQSNINLQYKSFKNVALSAILYVFMFGFGYAIAQNLIDIINISVGLQAGTISILSFIPTIVFTGIVILLIYLIIKTNVRKVGLAKYLVQ